MTVVNIPSNFFQNWQFAFSQLRRLVTHTISKYLHQWSHFWDKQTPTSKKVTPIKEKDINYKNMKLGLNSFVCGNKVKRDKCTYTFVLKIEKNSLFFLFCIAKFRWELRWHFKIWKKYGKSIYNNVLGFL